ncbi:unnamed protein product, partial [Angiostrongylus costaricensis]|uniref:Autophagy-related protein 101 n=1 Tax=Angiostrongylus costaricensis TaxID=334426 RepID=A0A158PMF4_ANGCS
SGTSSIFGSTRLLFQSLEIRQVNDAVSCIFHSLLTHRSVAKFQYKDDSNYSLGSLGTKEVECENIDLSYVSGNAVLRMKDSKKMIDQLLLLRSTSKSKISNRIIYLFPLSEVDKRFPFPIITYYSVLVPLLGTQISLEFFQRRPRPWPLPVESVAWERWILFLDIFKASSYDDLARMRVSVAESVGEIVLQLCSCINRQQYLPKMPTRTELSNVFDPSLPDCQPYLFKVCRVPIRPGKSIPSSRWFSSKLSCSGA